LVRFKNVICVGLNLLWWLMNVLMD